MIHITFLIQIFVWTLVTHTETDIKYKKSGVTLTDILKVKFDNVPKVSYSILGSEGTKRVVYIMHKIQKT